MESLLLNLPRELRDKILALVIATPDAAPEDAQSSGPRMFIQDYEPLGWFGSSRVQITEPKNRTEQIPTLLVSKQLHAETVTAILIHPARRLYVLDVMLVEEDQLYPTWLSVPQFSTRVDKVYASFRIIGGNKKLRTGFSDGDGGPPLIVWAFYSLLERFLKLGPVGAQPEKSILDRNISIQVLELDVRTPENARSMEEEKLHGRRRRGGGMTNKLMNSTFLARYIRREILCLLNMHGEQAMFGAIIYERVGVIKFLLDGQVTEEIDVATWLSKVTFGNSFAQLRREDREARFNKWKKAVPRRRILAGLPVVDYEEEEKEEEESF